jgi:glycosyltransferase involved in cell wall biosynthesis
MRVLHLPVVIANNSVVISKYLNRLGVESRVLSYFRTWLGYEADVNLDLDNLSPERRQQKLRAFVDDFLKQEAPRYDIFHFHFLDTLATGASFGGWNSHPERGPYWDLAALKAMGKKLVFSSFGSDVRNNSKIIYYQLKYEDPGLTLPYPPLGTRPQYVKLWQIAQYADAVVAGDTELSPHVPFSHAMIPIPIDLEPLEGLRAAPRPKDETFSILHAPSNNLLKGSRYILKVLEELRAAYGDTIEMRLVHGIPAQEALKLYPGRGIAIDQINMTLGLFALEAMYLGRPVICSLRPEEFAPDDPKVAAPVVRVANEAGLREATTDFIEGRRSLGAGELADYVVQNHGAERIAALYKDLYERLLSGHALPARVGQRWLAQFDRLIKGQKIDADDYYSKVTDLLLARRDGETLRHEIQQGLGLADDAELLAKLVLVNAAAGRQEAADQLTRQNSRVTVSAQYRQHFERARAIMETGLVSPAQ